MEKLMVLFEHPNQQHDSTNGISLWAGLSVCVTNGKRECLGNLFENICYFAVLFSAAVVKKYYLHLIFCSLN